MGSIYLHMLRIDGEDLDSGSECNFSSDRGLGMQRAPSLFNAGNRKSSMCRCASMLHPN